MKYMLVTVLGLLLFASARPLDALEFSEQYRIVPEHPRAGDEVFVHVVFRCATLLVDDPYDRELVIDGEILRLVLWALVADPATCEGDAYATFPVSLGRLERGDYQLVLRVGFLPASGGYQEPDLVFRFFSVGPALARPPEFVPSAGSPGLLMLALLTAALAALRLRAR